MRKKQPNQATDFGPLESKYFFTVAKWNWHRGCPAGERCEALERNSAAVTRGRASP
jgi:hypothetical protein